MPNGTCDKASLAVVELNDQVFNPTDLSDYMNTFVTDKKVPDITIYTMSDTVFNITNESSPDKTNEGNLDVMLTYGLVYPQPIIYYQIGDWDLWFDAVDKPDCVKSDGFKCGGTPLAQVISTSWGWAEDVGDASNIRQCNEFMNSVCSAQPLSSPQATRESAPTTELFKFLPQLPAPTLPLSAQLRFPLVAQSTLRSKQPQLLLQAAASATNGLFLPTRRKLWNTTTSTTHPLTPLPFTTTRKKPEVTQTSLRTGTTSLSTARLSKSRRRHLRLCPYCREFDFSDQ
jgi:hypothetical protein